MCLPVFLRTKTASGIMFLRQYYLVSNFGHTIKISPPSSIRPAPSSLVTVIPLHVPCTSLLTNLILSSCLIILIRILYPSSPPLTQTHPPSAMHLTFLTCPVPHPSLEPPEANPLKQPSTRKPTKLLLSSERSLCRFKIP